MPQLSLICFHRVSARPLRSTQNLSFSRTSTTIRQNVKRNDLVCDRYLENSLKQGTHEARGSATIKLEVIFKAGWQQHGVIPVPRSEHRIYQYTRCWNNQHNWRRRHQLHHNRQEGPGTMQSRRSRYSYLCSCKACLSKWYEENPHTNCWHGRGNFSHRIFTHVESRGAVGCIWCWQALVVPADPQDI